MGLELMIEKIRGEDLFTYIASIKASTQPQLSESLLLLLLVVGEGGVEWSEWRKEGVYLFSWSYQYWHIGESLFKKWWRNPHSS